MWPLVQKCTKFTALCRIKHGKDCTQARRPIQPVLITDSFSFCSMKRLEVLLPPLRWEASPLQVAHPSSTPMEFYQLSLTGSFKLHHGDLTSKAFFFANSNPSVTRRGWRPWKNLYNWFKLIIFGARSL